MNKELPGHNYDMISIGANRFVMIILFIPIRRPIPSNFDDFESLASRNCVVMLSIRMFAHISSPRLVE